MAEPRILIYDIETAGVNSFKPDLSSIINFGYKWFGEGKVKVLTIDQYPKWFNTRTGLNDRGLVIAALKIFEEADLMVAHYGDRFDRRFLQGRCALHHLPSPPPTKQRDTWQIARRAFNFSSNRLTDLVDNFRLPFKKFTKKKPDHWPGWWMRALAGDKRAIHEMAAYCAKDVLALECLYKTLRPYDYPHLRLYENPLCRLCGGHTQRRGDAYIGERKYQRYQCKSCGRWDRSRTAKES